MLDPEGAHIQLSWMRTADPATLRGTVQTGAAAFDWALHNLLGSAATRALDISRMENMARQVRPGAEGVLFLPTLMGSRTPYWDPNTRGVLMGFYAVPRSAPHRPRDL